MVPLFGHKIQEFYFLYVPSVESTWNQFKCENLDSSNYDNSYDSGDFSYACVIMHQYVGKKTKNVKNGYISFYKQLYMFFCMTISWAFDLHLWPQILNLVNTNNQPNGQNSNLFP